MRVLCTVTGSPSHARAMLPFARAFGAAGHDVVVAATPETVAVFDGAPVHAEAVMPPMRRAMEHMMEVRPTLDEVTPTSTALMPHMFAGPSVVEAVHAQRELCGDPDLVLRDGTEMAGMLLAEHLGVPHVSAPSGGANVLTRELMAETLAARRHEAGLDESGDPAPLYRYGRLDCMPPAWSLATPGTPRAMAYRQDDEVARNEILPAWIGELPADRPLVLAAVGTALPMMTEGPGPARGPDPEAVLRVVAEGAAGLDAEVVVATAGIAIDPPAGENVHLQEWVPQPLLLQCADLFVTHGGYNGVREAVRAGTPLVVVPQFGDQHHNASRVRELGLGRHSEQTAGAIAENCRAVLADDGVRARARQAQRAMLALPPVEACVDDLVALVAGARTAAA